MKGYEEIYAQMKRSLEEKTGVAIPDGGDMALRLAAVAAELESLWAQTDWTKKQCFPQLAAGEYLDRHAQMRGLSRGAPGRARGIMRFETDEVRDKSVNVPAGTVCLSAAGREFLTDEETEIPAGAQFCTVSATAREAGSAGNLPAESVSYLALSPVGISRCFNPDAFGGGTDGEDDEELRARVLESYKSLPNGSNRSYYQTVALETDGIAAVTVIPKARGLGTVDVIVAGEAGLPGSEAVSAVLSRLSAEREICVDIQVRAPETVSVPVTVAVNISEEAEPQTVLAAVKAALEDYFSGRLLGRDVLLARLGAVILGVEGAENYSFSLPAADVSISADELPVAGTITVTERG